MHMHSHRRLYAKAIAPVNPMLVINYIQLHATPVIGLGQAGQEVYLLLRLAANTVFMYDKHGALM